MQFVQGWVTSIDADAQTVRIDDEYVLHYDTLVYALGSVADTETRSRRRRVRVHAQQRARRRGCWPTSWIASATAPSSWPAAA